MTAIKICGITRRADAEAAAACGADFVGFVLWPNSPRAIGIDRVGDLVAALPPAVTPVGVFVNPSADEVIAAADAGIRIAQIHSDAPAFLRGVTIPIVRAVHLTDQGIEPDIPDELVLLDAHDPVTKGGTGKTIDWQRASRIARSRRVILAGGLTPANVAEAIATVNPFAVDVSSGVETSPGIKDHASIRAFITAVRESHVI
ncbi:MAG TPA: phosphoribosylanthranilate isomerase [Vicinamibacterales bacterium]|nr:phosphoribosylanthranilate isomerase [Vicinamibacterales bacterium]